MNHSALPDVTIVANALSQPDDAKRRWAIRAFEHAMTAEDRRTIERMEQWCSDQWEFLFALVRIALRTFDETAVDAQAIAADWITEAALADLDESDLHWM